MLSRACWICAASACRLPSLTFTCDCWVLYCCCGMRAPVEGSRWGGRGAVARARGRVLLLFHIVCRAVPQQNDEKDDDDDDRGDADEAIARVTRGGLRRRRGADVRGRRGLPFRLSLGHRPLLLVSAEQCFYQEGVRRRAQDAESVTVACAKSVSGAT